jgi:hypothetical protein
MDRLNDVFRFYRFTAWVLFMTISFSAFTQAKGPDFDDAIQYKLDLSGREVSYRLPGRLDKRFPLNDEQSKINIFDDGRYNGALYDRLLQERNWAYRGFFWQGSGGYFCMSSLRVQLTRLREPSTAEAILHSVQSTETEVIAGEYRELEIESISYRLEFTPDELNGLPILVSSEVNDRISKKGVKTSYHIPIGDSHYLSFRFDAAMVSDASKDKWLTLASQDMRRIMESVTVSQ